MKSIQELTPLFSFEVHHRENYFALAVDDTTQGEAYLKLLNDSASQHQLKDLFIWDSKKLKILITQKDFIQWQRKVLSKKFNDTSRVRLANRVFYKCGENYFTIPLEKETLDLLADNLRQNLRARDIDIGFTKDRNLGIIECSAADFETIQKKSLERAHRLPLEKIPFERDEVKGCYFTTVSENESPLHLKIKLMKQFKARYKAASVKIAVTINHVLNRLEISEDMFALIKKTTPKKREHQSILTRDIKFDRTREVWIIKSHKGERIRVLHRTFSSACIRLGFEKAIFQRNKDQLEILDEDFINFKTAYLKKHASKCTAYGIPLLVDNENKFRYAKVDNPHTMAKSFKKIAKILGLDIKFHVYIDRVVLSIEDYEKWIADPIIKASLVTEKPQNQKPETTVVARKKTSKPQKAENTKGGISAKYLEDAFIVPFDINSESTEEKQTLLSKGHVIPFQQLKTVLTQNKPGDIHLSSTDIDFHGMKAKVTFYKSKKGKIEDDFSNNHVVFVRGGRKEAAFMPTVKQHEKTIITLLMTRQEYEEMKQSLSLSPAARLPSHVNLCVIESCSLEKQPHDQQDSYLRTSNIKRAITYALAERLNLKNFVLMDDNTTQIQMAEKIASDASIESLFELFHQYQSQGTVCATLGSFEFYKPIKNPLEATALEDIEERLGSKIMYVDYARLSQKLKTEGKQLHEMVSPCSLWWGEDYFNMLALLKLMEGEEQSGLLGALPYSVAWHQRSHVQQNKAKTMPHFKLANIWLSIDESYLKSLTSHQQEVIKIMQTLVRKAVEKQNAKQAKYLENLERQQADEPEKAEQAKPYDLGYHRGVKIATYGYPFDIEKIKGAIIKDKIVKPGTEEDYIRGFAEGHKSIWDKLNKPSRAYHRGYHDGHLAAKQGYKREQFKSQNLPAIYQDQQKSYLDGFKASNDKQWQKMRETQNSSHVQAIARTMGAARAKSQFDINEEKLLKISAEFGVNAVCFEAAYRASFKENKLTSNMLLSQYRLHKELATSDDSVTTEVACSAKLGM